MCSYVYTQRRGHLTLCAWVLTSSQIRQCCTKDNHVLQKKKEKNLFSQTISFPFHYYFWFYRQKKIKFRNLFFKIFTCDLQLIWNKWLPSISFTRHDEWFTYLVEGCPGRAVDTALSFSLSLAFSPLFSLFLLPSPLSGEYFIRDSSVLIKFLLVHHTIFSLSIARYPLFLVSLALSEQVKSTSRTQCNFYSWILPWTMLCTYSLVEDRGVKHFSANSNPHGNLLRGFQAEFHSNKPSWPPYYIQDLVQPLKQLKQLSVRYTLTDWSRLILTHDSCTF